MKRVIGKTRWHLGLKVLMLSVIGGGAASVSANPSEMEGFVAGSGASQLPVRKMGVGRTQTAPTAAPVNRVVVPSVARLQSIPERVYLNAAAPGGGEKEVVEAPVAETVAPPETEPVKARAANKIRMAPVVYQFGGELSYNIRNQQIGKDRSTTQYFDANVRALADSFIWQPWFAKVRGGVVFGFRKNIADTGNSTGNSISGNLNLSLLPLSRFPFEAYLNRNNDDQSVSNGYGTFYQTKSYGFTQRFRPGPVGPDFVFSYDRDTWKNSQSFTGKQDVFKVGMTHQLGSQWFDIQGDVDRTTRSYERDRSVVKNLRASHNYRPGTVLSVESLADMTNTVYSRNGADTDVTYAQLNSSAFIRPEGKPLTANVGVRVYRQDVNSAINSAATSTTQSLNLNAGANYEYSKRLRLYANANVSVADSAANQSVSTNQGVGATYQPGSIDWGSYRYSRSLSTRFSNTTTEADGARQNFSLSPAHDLSRNIALGSGSFGLSLRQYAEMSVDSQDDNRLSLTHTGSVGWTGGGAVNSMVRLTASDSRVLQGEKSNFQLLNFQATLSDTIDRDSSWNGSLTVQASRQEIELMDVTDSVTASADLGYRNQRVMGVPRLRFSSDFRVSGDLLAPKLVGATQQDAISWDNRLDYSIGRSSLRLTARTAEANKIRESLLWFSLTRQF